MDIASSTFLWEIFLKFVMGDVLRKVAKEDSERGRVVHHVVENRLLIPPEIARPVISSELEALLDKTDTIVMDGYPRNLGQLAVLDSIHSSVCFVEIAVPKEICLERIEKAKDRGVRSDDIDPVIRERGFKTFENETAPMIQAIKKRSPASFYSVDGRKAVDAVAEDIFGWIKK